MLFLNDCVCGNELTEAIGKLCSVCETPGHCSCQGTPGSKAAGVHWPQRLEQHFSAENVQLDCFTVLVLYSSVSKHPKAYVMRII